MELILYLLWCLACTYAVRWLVVHLLKPRIGWLSLIAAYAAWLLLFGVGIASLIITEFDIYSARPTSQGVELIGYVVYIWSPLGLPVAIGAGPVILWDICVTKVKAFKRSRSTANATSAR